MFLAQARKLAVTILLVAFVAGCGPDYSPNTYSTTAVQQANKVDKGIIVGERQIDVSSAGVVGGVTGAAAGGIVGSNAPGGGIGSAFGAIGGGLVGGLIGSGMEHATSDTTAYEYIVRKPNGDLLSVTQKDAVPLAVGEHVLVIAGNQARIVPDYTVSAEPAPPLAAAAPTPAPTTTEPPPAPVTAMPLPGPPTAASAPAATPPDQAAHPTP
jgi:outer membrane lipoprotein SlyB